jgi:hypothetical protein
VPSSPEQFGPADGPSPAPAEGLPQLMRRFDPALLEEVLEETAEASGMQEPLQDPERERIRQVVQRHRGRPLVLDPVAVELVEAVLLVSFPQLAGSSALAYSMAKQVAATLMEDPQVRPRLAALWERLGGTAP